MRKCLLADLPSIFQVQGLFQGPTSFGDRNPVGTVAEKFGQREEKKGEGSMGNATKVALVALLILMVVVIAKLVRDGSEPPGPGPSVRASEELEADSSSGKADRGMPTRRNGQPSVATRSNPRVPGGTDGTGAANRLADSGGARTLPGGARNLPGGARNLPGGARGGAEGPLSVVAQREKQRNQRPPEADRRRVMPLPRPLPGRPPGSLSRRPAPAGQQPLGTELAEIALSGDKEVAPATASDGLNRPPSLPIPRPMLNAPAGVRRNLGASGERRQGPNSLPIDTNLLGGGVDSVNTPDRRRYPSRLRGEEGGSRVVPAAPKKTASQKAKTRNSGGGTNPKGKGRSYVIQDGDSLWRIAQRFYGDGTLHAVIAKANPGVPIQPQRQLVIPPRPSGTADAVLVSADPPKRKAKEPAGVVERTSEHFVYLVKPGDTLSGIAKKFYGDPKRYALLEEANQELKYQVLQADTRIRVPHLKDPK